ncbi:protease [Candidatus Koribacter versatilis Ellin345]|uniref:Protease n=1 Tax=Koribacter versatilis (strain Ellin345) TaxID=204669 RepID=Q1IUJ5_KORVE|nr:Ig-like domain repeat protein [Candidatus Koribacter versatilis]ABF39455.1 protease [Candidatus Koribacter versatilis Ellin345]
MSIRNRLLSATTRVALLLCACSMVFAQAPLIQNRVTAPIENSKTIKIRQTVSPLVAKSADKGRLAGDRNLGQMLLMLSPTKEQNTALEAVIKAEHTPGSAKYHHWLKASEIATKYGVSEPDTTAVRGWLASQGFEVKHVANSRRFVVFSGTVAQVEAAFHTQMHQYELSGNSFIANSQEVQIPAALAPVVRGVVRLTSTPKNNNVKIVGKAAFDKEKGQITFTNGEHAITPADFATIYNLNPLYQAGINGAGQSIAIVARSDIYSRDVFDFMSIFGVSFGGFYYTINGDDPGYVSGSDVEATLDLTWAAAIAPGATPNIVISQSNFADGVDISAAFIVDNNLAPVMSTSFSSCEQQMGPVGTEFYYSLWAQAAAEGITAVVSSDDSGGAGCDLPGSGTFAQNGLAVNALASTPFNVAVGGTQFDDTADPSKYWSSTNDSTTKASVLSYIPEKAWNESSIDSGNVSLWAGGGGVSTLWTKPEWQIGTGVPADGMRDLPDVSLTAAGHDGYVLCFGGSCESGGIYTVGGTSASAPAFAAIMALVNQQTGSPQGNPNYVIYQLAAQHPEFFHDTTVGDNKVPDMNGEFTVGYSTGVGYDLATGLGSFDANSLVTNWNNVTFSGTNTTLSGPAGGLTFVHGAGVPVTASVSAASGSKLPTGNVAFFTDNPLGLATPFGVGAAALDNTGDATTSLAAIPGGTHSLTARYGGDATFTASTSNAVTVTVTPEPSNTYFVAGVGGSTVTSAEAKYGDPLVMAVLVQGNSLVGHPTGSVSLSEGSTDLGTRYLNYGEHEDAEQGSSSVFGVIGFPVGVHQLTASYTGDPSFNPSTSTNFQLTIVKSDSTISSLQFQGSALSGAPLPVFGQVSLASGTLMPISGSVTFTAASDKTTVNLGSLTIDATSGTFAGRVSFPSAGSWVLTAVYGGDSNVTGTQTQTRVAVDSSEATTMSLSSNAPSVPAGGSVTFTAQVSSPVVLRLPTGTVTFMDGTASLGTATLDGYGIGKFTTTSLTGGSHSITANYGGDAIFRATSASVSQSISDFAVQPTTAAVSIKVGQSGTALIALTPQGGFNQAVTFSCSGLPSGASCTFAPATLTPTGTDVATDTMTIATSGSGAAAHRAENRRMNWLASSGFGLAGVLLLVPICNRKRRARLVVLAGLMLMLGLWGCGGSSSSSPKPPPPNPMVGTYSVTVTATSGTGSAHAADLSVTITQ